jgi:hypothetical protein
MTAVGPAVFAGLVWDAVILVAAVFGYVAWTLWAARRSTDQPSSSAGE